MELLKSYNWLLIPGSKILLILFFTYVFIIFKNKVLTKKYEIFHYSAYKPLTVLIYIMGLSFIFNIIESVISIPFCEPVYLVRKVSIILVTMWIGHRFIHKAERLVILNKKNYANLDKTSVLAISKLIKVLVYISGALVILPTFGIPISGVLALGGIGGMGIAFAAKDMVANFLGGAMLYAERPFSVGDLIEAPQNNIMGVVENIGWRTTKIRMVDRRLMFVPNSTFSTINVINSAKRTHYRMYEKVGIRYEDIKAIPSIVNDIRSYLDNRDDIDSDEILYVGLEHMGDFSLDCLIWCFAKCKRKLEYLKILEDVLLNINVIVEKHGAQIAYPTQTILSKKIT